MPEIDVIRGLEFARTASGPLALDLYRPAAASAAPVVVYLHGGGWAVGSREAFAAERLEPVARHGVAVASASYRFSDVATYPAQVHDAKAAVRWLRANGTELGLATARIGAWGASAGGFLALTLGLSAGVPALEGELGEHLGEDSSVAAVCDWFAPVDLSDPTGPGEHPPPPFLTGPPPVPSFQARLLGLERVEDDLAAARAASPLHLVGSAHGGARRYLLVHGDRDGLVPDRDSRAMHAALRGAGIDSSLVLLAGVNHEGPEFHRPEVLAAVAGFFAAAL